MSVEKEKLLALRELVVSHVLKGSQKSTEVKFKAEILETDQGIMVKLVEGSLLDKDSALKKEFKSTCKLIKIKKEPKKKSRKFYNDMRFLNQ